MKQLRPDFHCEPWGLEGLNYGGSAPLPDADPNDRQWWYSWHYYFFHREAVAVAERYMKKSDDPPKAGTWISKDGDGYGYDVHFYLLGCQHPNWKWDSPRMHDQHVKCPDCGF